MANVINPSKNHMLVLHKMILINPPFHRFFGHKNRQTPAGLAYLASYLRKNHIKVNILNLEYCNLKDFVLERDNISELFWTQLKKTLLKYKSTLDVVGITASTPQINDAIRICQIIKDINPESKIIIGGIHATVLPEEVLNNDCVDIVAIGESEITMLNLAEAILGNKPYTQINGIYYKQNGEIKSTPPRERITDLDALPFPEFDFIDLYGKKIKGQSKIVVTSRGCPFSCSFCARKAVWQSKVTLRSPENVVEELKSKVKDGITYFEFFDDCFTMDKSRAIKLCNLILANNLNITWDCQTRVEFLDADLLRCMKKAGCIRIGLGLESASPRILQKYNKNPDLSKTIEVSQLIKQMGMELELCLIIGHPTEQISDLLETDKLLNQLQPDHCNVFYLTPFPGSPLYYKLDREGAILTKDWGKYSPGPNEGIFQRHLDKKTLQKYYDKWSLKYGSSKPWKYISFKLYLYKALVLLFRNPTKLFSHAKSDLKMILKI